MSDVLSVVVNGVLIISIIIAPLFLYEIKRTLRDIRRQIGQPLVVNTETVNFTTPVASSQEQDDRLLTIVR